MPAAKPAMPSHLHFPPELWSITTQNFYHRKSPEDLTYLWTTVRQVFRQFEEEIEDLFRTEHLPKTWLHIDTANHFDDAPTNTSSTAVRVSDFKSRSKFDRIQARFPGRAVSSLQPEHTIQLLDGLASTCAAFKGLQARLGPGTLGGADGSVPGPRMRFFESPTGMFVVQVRGAVGDCPLPALNVDPIRCELSFEWKKLFDRIFGERKLAPTVLHSAPADHAPAHTTDLHFDSQSLATLHVLISRLSPGLQALATLDWRTHHRHYREFIDAITRIRHLRTLIQNWADAMGEELGQTEANLNRCLCRRQADRAIGLDDEGATSQEKSQEKGGERNQQNSAGKLNGSH